MKLRNVLLQGQGHCHYKQCLYLGYIVFKKVFTKSLFPPMCLSAVFKCFPNTFILWSIFKLEDLKVLKRSPDLLNNVKIGQGQLRLIIQTYFVLPYMGNGHFDQVT